MKMYIDPEFFKEIGIHRFTSYFKKTQVDKNDFFLVIAYEGMGFRSNDDMDKDQKDVYAMFQAAIDSIIILYARSLKESLPRPSNAVRYLIYIHNRLQGDMDYRCNLAAYFSYVIEEYYNRSIDKERGKLDYLFITKNRDVYKDALKQEKYQSFGLFGMGLFDSPPEIDETKLPRNYFTSNINGRNFKDQATDFIIQEYLYIQENKIDIIRDVMGDDEKHILPFNKKTKPITIDRKKQFLMRFAESTGYKESINKIVLNMDDQTISDIHDIIAKMTVYLSKNQQFFPSLNEIASTKMKKGK